MIKTIHAFFDGQVFRPEDATGLTPNQRYLVTVEREENGDKPVTEQPYPLTEILGLATDMGVADLSTRHDWYAHRRLGDEDRGD